MKTLANLVNAQGLSNRRFAEKAGISFRAIADIRSGKFEEALQNRNGAEFSKKKRIGAIQVMSRVLIACGENPQEWVKTLGLEIDSREQQAMFEATSQRPRPLLAPGLGGDEWNTLLLIADTPLTKEDIEQLSKAQEVLGDFFTIKRVIQLLIHKHKKSVGKE
ncbi:MAG TPA: hypothetical protein VJB58_00935 [Candidatus Paceibacterota bacterium]